MNLQDIQFNKKEPMYPQLSRYIKKLILADELKHYEELPSRRELALQLSINPNTVQDRKSTRLNSSHITRSRMPSSA